MPDNVIYAFAAYTIAWIGFFAYSFTLSRRQASLRDEVEQVRRRVDELARSRGGSQ